MSYFTQSLLAKDEHISARVTACAALEGLENPEGFAFNHRWQLSAQPGWDAAYASALEAGVADPGRDGSVITDVQILSAVQILNSSSPA